MSSNLIEVAENNGDSQVGGSEPAGFRKIGILLADIVGIRHFSGIIRGGETVILVREFSEWLFSIMVIIDTEGVRLNGYVQRDIANVLSPWIDLGWIYVEGIVPITTRSKIQCEIHIFARIEVSTYVNAAINGSGLGFLLRPEVSPVDEIFSAMGLESKRRRSGVGPMEPMREIIKSELMVHQKEALGWMVHREDPSQLPPFWEFENGKYVNELTNSDNGVCFPDPLLGGIYADKMGLGKTLTLLSLIAFDKSHLNDENLERSSKRLRIESNEGKTTLVICPPSALCTWVSQIREHTHEGSLSVYMYYGKRTRDLEELKKVDIVLTTYRIVGLEASRPEEKNILKRMKWHRIILDEAHVHQDTDNKDTLAVNDLQAKIRWAVTGMPMETMDMYTLMCFLRLKPLNIKTQWYRYIQGYLALGDERGLLRFAIVMDTISLMRRNEVVLVGLPPKFIETFVLELSDEERELYDEIEEGARNIIQSNFTNEVQMPQFGNAVTLISTLRRICTDVALCRHNFKSLIALPDIEDVSNKPKLLQKLIQWLQDEEEPSCPICICETKDVVITQCGHVFCRACIVKSLQWGKGCPTCRRLLDYQCDLFALPIEQQEVMASSYKTITSTKVTFLLNHLSHSRKVNPAGKSVVFTHFEDMLPLLEKPLKARGFKVVRLDSKKSPITRAKVIEKFNTCGIDGPTVMVASLKASGMGINLPGVSTVYLFEPWWNPFVEDQAIGRVHRIGQKEKVEVIRIVVTNTIEEKVLYLQEWKRDKANEDYGELGSLVGRELKRDDFRFLMSL